MSENNAPVETPAINSAVPEIALQEAPQNAETAPDKVAAKERAQNRNASHAQREAKKEELLAKLRSSREAKAEGESPKTDDKPKTEGVEAKADGDKGPEPKTEAKPDRSVATIAKQSQELRDLKAKLATFEGKPGVESKEDFLAKVKADPSILFKEIDDPELLTKLAGARYVELTPEEKLKAEVDAKLAAYEKKLADAETEKKTAAQQAFESTAHGSFSKILNEGFKSDDGSIVIDVSKYKLCQKLTKAGEEDAPRRAMGIVKGLSAELGRNPTEAETATLISIAYDSLEELFTKKADAYRLDAPESQESTKTNTDRAKDQPPKTINSRMASGGRLPAITPKPVTRAEREQRKAEIMNKYTRQRAQEMRG